MITINYPKGTVITTDSPDMISPCNRCGGYGRHTERVKVGERQTRYLIFFPCTVDVVEDHMVECGTCGGEGKIRWNPCQSLK